MPPASALRPSSAIIGTTHGCLRDDQQYIKAYRYTLNQAVRAGLARAWREYRNTRVFVTMEDGLAFAREKRAFLHGVPYKRYQNPR